MNDPLFEELLESVREGAAIIRGEARPSRLFKINNQVSGVEMPEISRFYGNLSSTLDKSGRQKSQ